MNIIISGFPGVGKTALYNLLKDSSLVTILDSDSSNFPKFGFPDNYLNHIEKEYNEIGDLPKIILVSTHADVRQGLSERALPYELVIPYHSLKEEYLQRYKERGSNQAFVDLMSGNWENFISTEPDEAVTVLESAEYLSQYSVPELYEMVTSKSMLGISTGWREASKAWRLHLSFLEAVTVDEELQGWLESLRTTTKADLNLAEAMYKYNKGLQNINT